MKDTARFNSANAMAVAIAKRIVPVNIRDYILDEDGLNELETIINSLINGAVNDGRLSISDTIAAVLRGCAISQPTKIMEDNIITGVPVIYAAGFGYISISTSSRRRLVIEIENHHDGSIVATAVTDNRIATIEFIDSIMSKITVCHNRI